MIYTFSEIHVHVKIQVFNNVNHNVNVENTSTFLFDRQRRSQTLQVGRDAGFTAYIWRRAVTIHKELQAIRRVLIQIAIGQVLQLFQSDSHVFAVPSLLSKNCALQHALRVMALPCNGTLRSHLQRWLRVCFCMCIAMNLCVAMYPLQREHDS